MFTINNTFHNSLINNIVCNFCSNYIKKTAGCLLIGNELLNGSVKDENLQPLAKLLFYRGIILTEVKIIGDYEDLIVNSIRNLQDSVDYIFTTGGIGCTHDDITYSAIAKAYNDSIVLDEGTKVLLNTVLKHKERIPTEEHFKMCKFPSKAKIIRSKSANNILQCIEENKPLLKEDLEHPISWVPLIVIDSCYIFPGVPKIYQQMLSVFEDNIPVNVNYKIYTDDMYFNKPEGDIALLLENTEKLFNSKHNNSSFTIGSYLELINDKYHVRVRLQSNSKQILEEAKQYLSQNNK